MGARSDLRTGKEVEVRTRKEIEIEDIIGVMIDREIVQIMAEIEIGTEMGRGDRTILAVKVGEVVVEANIS